MPGIKIESYHGEERRREPRIPVCLAVAAECDSWMGICHTKDVSKSGLFLISQRIPSISTGFSVQLKLPVGIGSLVLHATVIRIQGDYPRGFGLQWTELSEENHDRLEELHKSWNKAFPVLRA
jgi:hypothetical protein